MDEISILLRFVLAFIVLEFVVYPGIGRWGLQSRARWSEMLVLRGVLYAVLIYFLSQSWGSYWIIPVVLIVYLVVELFHRVDDGTGTFVARLVGHLLVLTVVWAIVQDIPLLTVLPALYGGTNEGHLLVLAVGYGFVLWPIGVLIGHVTADWRDAISVTGDAAADSLINAGRWIGYLERAAIVTFVLLQAYEAIGLLIAAKSILRFGDRQTRAISEYVLVGTLFSVTSALIIGIIMSKASVMI